METRLETKLNLKLTQKLIMTPQLQQAIRILQLSRLELTQMISQEIVENPVLEEDNNLETTDDISDSPSDMKKKENDSPESPLTLKEGKEGELLYKWDEYLEERNDGRDMGHSSGFSEEFPSYEQLITRPTTLISHLLWQLGFSPLSEKEKEIGQLIIGNIDDNGYLRASIEEIAELSKESEDRVNKVLQIVQGYDPPGVASRDLKECLLIQTRQLDLKGSLVEIIISDYWEDFARKKYYKIAKKIGVRHEEIFQAIKIIEKLEPKPGRPFSYVENSYIIPDVFIIKNEKDYVVLLNDEGSPRLKVNNFYKRLLKSRENVSDSTRAYLEDRFRSAIWLIKSMEQRNKTICKVTESIVKFQRDFFNNGINHLKPLVLKQVADDISVHESTISRVTAKKYVYSPQGLFELKFFFNSSVPMIEGEDDELSSTTVREIIRKIVAEEDSSHPFKDHDIFDRLKNKNIKIARRTIAKYRAELNIPPANQRKRPY
ncbi:MAG: RNA polymerase factor sigma-54 [Nitrospirota bacterium]